MLQFEELKKALSQQEEAIKELTPSSSCLLSTSAHPKKLTHTGNTPMYSYLRMSMVPVYLSRHSSEPKALLRRTAVELSFFHLVLPETDFSFSFYNLLASINI